MGVTSEHEIDFLVIRGVSDFADSAKNTLEELSKNLIRKIAARNAASFLQMQTKNPYFVEVISRRRPNFTAVELPLDLPSTAAALPSIQELLMDVTVARLRETNQVFRTLPEGSILPLPRLRPSPSGNLTSPPKADPIEIREAVVRNNRIVTSIPRAFPDKSLSWMIAHALHYETEDDYQLVPIVVPGADVRPPRGTIEALTKINLKELIEDGGKPVIIIDSFKLGSKTNSAFLAEQMTLNPECTFVVLTHDEPNPKELEAFVAATNSHHFEIWDTSFSEMTQFFSRHFSIKRDEAQVVALRLHDLFRKFKLQVHPTFFAGIPQEMVTAILDANRRGELIQLAVDGYLTFLVSEDQDSVRLSRTTRARFLRALVRHIKIEKRSLDSEALLQFAADHFTVMGYPNDPKTFIQDFYDKNILIDQGECVGFGLTFVEAYFTALELGDDPNEAITYFEWSDPSSFDFLAYDLYAELCAHPGFVDHLINRGNSFERRASGWEDTSGIADGTIHPLLLQKNGHVKAVQHRIQVAVKAVNDGRDETASKQKFLDVADRVYVEVSEARREKSDAGDSQDDADPRIPIWVLSTVLLGQGSEKIKADKKVDLANYVLHMGSEIMDQWCAEVSQFDFEKLKSELLNPTIEDKIIPDDADLGTSLTKRELIESFVDIIEVMLLSEPIRSMTSTLCEQARNPVLISTVGEIQPDGPLSRFLYAAWVGEMNLPDGKKALTTMEKSFPNSPFFRTAAATHFVERVYWSLANKGIRLQILRTANSLLEPINRGLPIAAIKKQIESDGVA